MKDWLLGWGMALTLTQPHFNPMHGIKKVVTGPAVVMTHILHGKKKHGS